MQKIVNILVVLILSLFFPQIVCAHWVDIDQNGKDNINITNSQLISSSPIVRFNPNSNQPAIVWEEDFSFWQRDICFLQWNGSAWVDADGTGEESKNITNNSFKDNVYPSFAFNPVTGYPAIVWSEYGGMGDIYFLQWNGNEWVDVDGSGAESKRVIDIAIGAGKKELVFNPSTGYPSIAWVDIASHNWDIYFLQWNGSAWVDVDGVNQESINVYSDAEWSYNPSLSLNSQNYYPMIAWQEGTAADGSLIYFLQWNGSAWVDVDGVNQESINVNLNSATASIFPTLAVNPQNNYPAVAWTEGTAGSFQTNEIYYLTWNGSSWVDSDGTGQENINISNTLGTDSQYPRINLLSNNYYPSITWSEDGNDIYYLEWNGMNWSGKDGVGQENANVSNNQGGSYQPFCSLDPMNNNPAIAWVDNSSGNVDVFYLQWITSGEGNGNDSVKILPETGLDLGKIVTQLLKGANK